MGYFKSFPFVTTSVNSVDIYGVNLTKRTGILKEYKENPRYFIEYNILDGDTPESIADKLYGDASLSWIVLMFNDIINVFDEWPLDYQSLISFSRSLYDDIYAIKLYRSISLGVEVDYDYPEYDRLPITCLEHEIEQNDAKRKIKLLIPEYISQCVSQHNKAVAG